MQRLGAPRNRPILIVEDDIDARSLLAAILERRGHEVVTCSNGREAFEFVSAGDVPRLILLDLHMPMMDGYELHEALAGHQELSLIPVVLMTVARDIDRERIGSTAVIAKPLKIRELLALVEDR